MAEVYKAYQSSLDRHVAIKLLHGFLVEDEEFLQRFRRGAKLAARLHHPNIVQVFDLGVVDGVYHFLVMEHIAGMTLGEHLASLKQRGEGLPLSETLRIVKEIASALSYAHGLGMVHRDVKPSNIMLDETSRAVLTDFGVAKLLGGTQYTGTGALVGTPHYISPEQAMGKREDVRSDIYSLGAVLFQLVTGRLPYEAESAGAILLKHLSDPVPTASNLNPSLPPIVDHVIYRAMAKDLQDRYQVARELMDGLDEIGAELGTDTGPSVPVRPDVPPPSTQAFASRPTHISQRPTTITAVPGSSFMATELMEPYVLTTKHIVTDPTELPAACDAQWERAVEHFVAGYITEWLRDGARRLRTIHRHGAADDLERIAIRADAIIQRVKQDELVKNAGLEEFLESLGAERPVLKVSPEEIALESVGVGDTGQDVNLTITNEGRGYLFGSVACRVPWLEVDPEWFGCFSGESFQVTVEPDLAGLPAGRLRSPDAIRILSVGGEKSLAVEVDVESAELEVETPVLDFGVLGLGETGETSFTVRNGGAGLLACRVRARVPWLSVFPTRFKVPAGQTVEVTVLIGTESLTPGTTRHEWALAIESNGGEAVLGLKVEVLEPQLSIDPASLDLGDYDIASGEREPADLNLENAGPGVLNGALVSMSDWLTVEPATFRCRSGETQSVQVYIQQPMIGEQRGAIRVASNAGSEDIPVRVRVQLSCRPEMVFVPAGEFLRGSPEDDPLAEPCEMPQQEIFLSDYWIGRYPVTNEEYAVFLLASGRRPPSHWQDEEPPKGWEQHPVVGVSWWDAHAYCQWLSDVTDRVYRLPTEAQWEKAARGTDGRRYPWGAHWRRGRCNSAELGKGTTTEVGAFSPPGDSPYRCADAAGNILEWVSDFFHADYYERSSVTKDPYGPASGAVKTLRGGSWSSDQRGVRCTSRYNGNQKTAGPEAGFRVAIWSLWRESESD